MRGNGSGGLELCSSSVCPSPAPPLAEPRAPIPSGPLPIRLPSMLIEFILSNRLVGGGPEFVSPANLLRCGSASGREAAAGTLCCEGCEGAVLGWSASPSLSGDPELSPLKLLSLLKWLPFASVLLCLPHSPLLISCAPHPLISSFPALPIPSAPDAPLSSCPVPPISRALAAPGPGDDPAGAGREAKGECPRGDCQCRE